MIPLVDIHCHLLAGLDDGPRTEEDALEMCRLAYAEGTRMVAATAHQNEDWPSVTPERILEASKRLCQNLREQGIPLMAFPTAEVMVHPGLEAAWRKGEHLGLAGGREYVLLEMPHDLYVELGETVKNLRRMGVRPILAHPERHEELLHDAGRIEHLIRLGCLVQVSSSSLTAPPSSRTAKALRSWLRRGIVHLLGSDGHSPVKRQPRMYDAYCQICRWAGNAVADRIASTNGVAILHGLPLRIETPQPTHKRWFSRFW
ncbi:MAG TPA: CpsB/CapC family capsule biosynthesis tyrosine phosphatase [Gemmataceae bacterium]|nr:CpsB/CapC family capsule biosynthesis tyrosine phosphatase [Gemmataceae bacterium]